MNVIGLWGKVRKGTATREDIEMIYSHLDDPDSGLKAFERRIIEGDLQEALNNIKKNSRE